MHPEMGSVSPSEFIPLVEETALITPLTTWVMKEVIRQAGEWQRRKYGLCISMNVSPHNLEEKDFADRLDWQLKALAVDPKSLELEFTERTLMRNASAILAQLQKIRSQSVEIAIDDFGTGYSNHSYLHQISARAVHIDQSLIANLGRSERDRTIVKSMIGMMHELGYKVVAEGVETQQAFDLLREWKCDEAQGNLISRPLEATAMEEWLKRSISAA
jgi:EAL domain-containing protein (putative c-di-GMP-specific phosphodiesterase class I)